MTTEEAKNNFIQWHNSAIEKTTILMKGVDIAPGEFLEFQKNVFRGGLYLKQMGYSNIHSIRSIVDAYSWETEISTYGLDCNNLPYFDEAKASVRAFVIYTFQQRFNMIIIEEENAFVAIKLFSNIKISTKTTDDYRVLYAELLQKESAKWYRCFKSRWCLSLTKSNIKMEEGILFDAMGVELLDSLSHTLGAIDDFIMVTDFNSSKSSLYVEILSVAFGGLIVNNEDGKWLCPDHKVFISAVFLDYPIHIKQAIQSHIDFKECNMVFRSYIEELAFSRQVSIEEYVSMLVCPLQSKLALNQFWTIKN